MELKVWQIDLSGVLVGEVILSKNAGDFKEGSWVIPAGCVEIEPPEEKEGYLLKFNGESWEYEEILKEEEEIYIPTQQDLLNQLNEWFVVQNKKITSNMVEDLSFGLTLEEAQETAAEDREKLIAEYEEKLAVIQAGGNPFEGVQ